MKKRIVSLAIVIAVIGIAWWGFARRAEAPTDGKALSYKDATYMIDGTPVTLMDGVAEMPAAPGSASKIVTRYFGNELRKDLDGDGREDVVFLLTQQTGGSGTFYYVVAALDTAAGWKGSDGYLLGDRIAPQTTESGEGKQVIINYADRKQGESFAVRPSVGKSAYLILDPATMRWGVVDHDFPGEADPSRMTLGMKTWNWVSAGRADGTTLVPKKEGSFTLAFQQDGRVSVGTDCNAMGGTYTVHGTALTFSEMNTTLMYCDGSQEQAFAALLSGTASYRFTSRGELILVQRDGGTATFR